MPTLDSLVHVAKYKQALSGMTCSLPLSPHKLVVKRLQISLSKGTQSLK